MADFSLGNTPKARELRLQLQHSAALTENPFSFTQFSQDHSGDRWIIEADFGPLRISDAGDLLGTLLQLRGTAKTFTYSPYNKTAGTATSITAAGGSNNTLKLSAINGTLLQGDLIETSDGSDARLYQAVSTASSGSTAITVVPTIRGTPSGGNLSNPKGTFRLDSDGLEFEMRPDRLYNFRFRAIESL